MHIEFNWQRRAVIVLAGSLVFLSVALAIFAIRDVERERLLTERAAAEEQRRCADAIGSQVVTTLSLAEERVGKLLQRYRENLDEVPIAEFSKGIIENEELVLGTFLVHAGGRIIFAGAKPLFLLPGEEKRSGDVSGDIWNSELRIQAENAEFQRRNHPEAIASYQELMAETLDRSSRTFILARIGRCYLKSQNSQKAIETYRKVLEICPPHITAEDIPLGVIAWSQIEPGHRSQSRTSDRALL